MFPQDFSLDTQKVSYNIGLLQGKALRWAEAFFDESKVEETSLDEFLELINLTFSPVKNEEESARKLCGV